MKVYFGTSKRGNKKYWSFASDYDDANFLYPTSMLLNECKERYAAAHGYSVDSLEFIDLD